MARNYVEVVQECYICHKRDKMLVEAEGIAEYSWNYTQACPEGWQTPGFCSKKCWDKRNK